MNKSNFCSATGLWILLNDRYLRARNTSECGVHVDDVNDLVRDTTGRDFSRPANNEGGAERRLHRREVGSAPGTSVTLPWIGTFGSVIAAEDDDRVVIDTGFMDGVEDLAGAIVHLGEGVGPVTVAGLANKARMRNHGHVDHGGGDVRVEGLVRGSVPFDEGDGAVGNLSLHSAAGTEIDFDSSGQRLNGAHAYTVTFPAGQTPPVDGFWSLTLYNDEHLFERNSLNRFSLGTKSKSMKQNPDGSLTIYVQNASPGLDKQDNWLPSPRDNFSLYIRGYWPKEEITSGHWIPPLVKAAH